MEKTVALHLARYVLTNHFCSKHAMADSLGISYRGLLRLFHGSPNQNDLEQIIYRIMVFCHVSSIPPRTILHGLAAQ